MKDINLVPKSYFLKRKKRKKIVFYSIFSVVVAVVLALVALLPIFQIQSLKNRLTYFDLKAKETNGYIQTENEFNAFKSLYMQRENEANRLSKSGVDMLKIIEKLESYMPDKIFIKSMLVSIGENGKAEITIRGNAASEKEIASFGDHISKDGYFSSINIRTVTSIKTSRVEKDNSKSQNNNKDHIESNSSYSFDAVIFFSSGM